MNTSELAAALRKISEGVWDLSAAIESSGSGRPDGPEAGRALPAPATTFSDGRPIDEPPTWVPDSLVEPLLAEAPPYTPLPQTERDRVLGECPVHFAPWTIKPGGVSQKTGQPYGSFWKCAEKNDDGSYCNKKPVKDWVKTHDPEKALAAA